jgi:hypothetical protein
MYDDKMRKEIVGNYSSIGLLKQIKPKRRKTQKLKWETMKARINRREKLNHYLLSTITIQQGRRNKINTYFQSHPSSLDVKFKGPVFISLGR